MSSSPEGSPGISPVSTLTVEQLAEQRRLALDTADMGWWSLDLKSGRVQWDQRIRAMFEVDREYLSYEEVLPLLHPEDAPALDRAIKAAINPQNPQPYSIQYRIVRPDGSLRWLISKGKVYFEGAGTDRHAVTIAGTAVDITETKAAQDALLESEARFRFLSELGEATRDLTDPEEVMATVTHMLGRHMKVSCCAYADVEADSDSFTIRHDYTNGMPSIVGHYHLSVFGARAASDQRNGRVFVMRSLNLEYAGQEGLEAFKMLGVQATICCPLVKAGRLVAMMAVHHKLSRNWTSQEISLVDAVVERSWAYIEQARGARELQRSEAEFRQLADAMPQIVWAAGADGRIYYYNQQWYSYTGQPHGSVCEDSWTAIVDPRDEQQANDAWSVALQSGQPYENEYRLRRAGDGMFRWHLGRALPFRDSSGKIVRWLGTDTDIHDQKMLEHQKKELLELERLARQEAERQGRAKDEFLATLSHELRTPLNSILGWSELLNRGTPKPADLFNGLEVIARNARNQAQIIEDLLDMNRIVSGKIRLEIHQISLASVMREAMETVRAAAEAKEIRLKVDFAETTPKISGDPHRLQQVFWNILNNAIKFTPRGGEVRVTLDYIGDQVEARISDRGEGIDPAFLPLVFNRFQQADASSTRRHGGLGLGLAIVKQLVELHGGRVQAESPGLGKGATFLVALPAAVASLELPEPKETADPESIPSLNGVRVLVVDDEADARSLVRRVLEEAGATVQTAGSAAEAVQLFHQEIPAVLVSDIGMPGEDGYALIRKIRALEAHERHVTPALALTAYARAEDRNQAILAGFQMHVAKPVEPLKLTSAVARLAELA